jgi:hypothetical protein
MAERLRFQVRTILLVVAGVALLLVVAIQQIQIGRMQRVIDAAAKDRAQMAQILREQRDALERQR